MIDPAVNPQITTAQGRYGWNVAAGCWYVVVAKTGYNTLTSPVVGVPPEVTDLDLQLVPIAQPQPQPQPQPRPRPKVVKKVTICHKVKNAKGKVIRTKTMKVTPKQLKTHRKHKGKLGACKKAKR